MTDAKKTTAKRNVYKRVFDARQNMEKLARTTEGQVGKRKYNYVTHENVIDCCLGPLADEGILIVQSSFVIDGEQGVRTELINVELPAEMIAAEMYIPRLEDPQKIGAWITYLKKYTLKGLLGLPDTDDDDGASASGNNAGNVARRPKYEPGAGTHTVTPIGAKIAKEDRSAGWVLYAIDTSDGEFTTFDKDVANACRAAASNNAKVNVVFEEKKGRVSATSVVD